jgi:hypothetical protein
MFIESTGPSSLFNRMMHWEAHILSKDFSTQSSPGMPLQEKVDDAYSILRGDTQNPYRVVDPSRVNGSCILMVDDVFTSGYHTMFPVGLALREAGAEKVDVLVIGRHKWTD